MNMRLNKKAAFLLAAAILVCAWAYHQREALSAMLSVFVYAVLFALLLAPLERILEQKGMSASLASAACIALIIACALMTVASFVPYLVSHCADLIRRSIPTLSSLLQQTALMLERFGIDSLRLQGAAQMLAEAMGKCTALLARASVSFAAQTGRILFSVVIAYYLLSERKKTTNHLILCLPLAWRNAFLSAMRGCRNAALGYLSSVLKTSLFVGGATYLGLVLLGVPDALLLALFMGIFEVLPYIGPVLAAIPILLSVLPQGMEQTLLALVLLVLVQQLEGNFVSPYFTASSTSIHPLTALVSVFVFGSLLGLWGILLAVPIVVTARSVFWSLRQASSLMQAQKN